MITIKNQRAIAIAATVLCMVSFAWLMSTQRVNHSLETNLENEKLRSESLLSEKLLLEKDLEKMRLQLSSLRGINDELDQVVKITEQKFANQESELMKLRARNFSMADLNRQREVLQGLRRDLEDQLTALKQSYTNLENENKALSSTIANLQERNMLLSEDLGRAMLASVDHSQVDAVRGKKERLTVRAKRANKLVADFQVPATMKDISYRIVDPNGNALTAAQGMIVSHAVASEGTVTASVGETVADRTLQKVRMEYMPKQKLRAGVYKVEIMNENLYVSSLNVKLR